MPTPDDQRTKAAARAAVALSGRSRRCCSSSPRSLGTLERRALRLRRRSAGDQRARRLSSRTRSRACSRATARRSASSPSNAASSSATTTWRRCCGRPSSPARTPSFEQHFGVSVSRIVITAVQDASDRPAHSAPARSRSSWRAMLFLTEYMQDGVFERTGFKGLERKVKEIARRDSDREALHQARNPDDLRQPDQPGPRRSTASKRPRALYFDKPAKDADARGSRDDRRDHPDARAPQPVRQP